MAAAAKTHIAEKGGNPKNVTIVAFGEQDRFMHIGLCKKLGAPRLLVPPNAGVGSALGFSQPLEPSTSFEATKSLWKLLI